MLTPSIPLAVYPVQLLLFYVFCVIIETYILCTLGKVQERTLESALTYGIFHLSNIALITLGAATIGLLMLSMWPRFIERVRRWAYAVWVAAALLITVFTVSLWTHDPNSNPPAHVLLTAMFIWLYGWVFREIRHELRLLD